MELKTFPAARVKAIADADEPGTFEALVAVFNNIDSYGDKVLPGAFTETLQKGLPPIVYSHQWGTVPIGVTLEGKETNEGLVIKGRLLVAEGEDHPEARKVYAAMKAIGGDGQPPLREFSFAYDIIEGGWEVEDGEEFFALKQVELIEVGPCLKGVNDQTRLIGVKSDAAPDGRERPPRPSEQKADSPPETGDEETGNPEPNSDEADETAETDEEAKARTRRTVVDVLYTP